MILANLLSLSITFCLILFVVVCLLLVLVIMMQRPKQEGLGAAFGGGVTDSMWGARTTDVLQTATKYFAIFYFGTALVLAILIARENAEQGRRHDAGFEASAEEVVVEVEGEELAEEEAEVALAEQEALSTPDEEAAAAAEMEEMKAQLEKLESEGVEATEELQEEAAPVGEAPVEEVMPSEVPAGS